MLTDSGGISRDSSGGSSISLTLLPEDANYPSELPLVLDSDKGALQHLVNHATVQDELPSVIETIVSNMKAAEIVKCLQGDEVQVFIDVVDEARRHPIDSLRDWFIDPCLNPPFLSSRR